jgi:phosphoribosylformimino-5-aminoimidazole carboxamide ribotide isomerase
MMQGLNIGATRRLAEAGGIPVIASGGVTTIEDIRLLAREGGSGIVGAISGRALYEGTLDLASAQAWCDANTGAD